MDAAVDSRSTPEGLGDLGTPTNIDYGVALDKLLGGRSFVVGRCDYGIAKIYNVSDSDRQANGDSYKDLRYVIDIELRAPSDRRITLYVRGDSTSAQTYNPYLTHYPSDKNLLAAMINYNHAYHNVPDKLTPLQALSGFVEETRTSSTPVSGSGLSVEEGQTPSPSVVRQKTELFREVSLGSVEDAHPDYDLVFVVFHRKTGTEHRLHECLLEVGQFERASAPTQDARVLLEVAMWGDLEGDFVGGDAQLQDSDRAHVDTDSEDDMSAPELAREARQAASDAKARLEGPLLISRDLTGEIVEVRSQFVVIRFKEKDELFEVAWNTSQFTNNVVPPLHASISAQVTLREAPYVDFTDDERAQLRSLPEKPSGRTIPTGPIRIR